MTAIGNSAQARDIAYHVHGYTNLKAHETKGPLVINRGAGIRVFDDSGKSYIEGLSGLWCVSLGFGEQRLIDAATEAMGRLAYYHGFNHRSADVVIDLAEKLVSIAPGRLNKVLFANSGSEATDLAVKLIWYYHNAIGKPEKKKIISRIRGYHGVTVASASLTGLPHLHGDFDLPINGILHTTCPHYYREGKEGESEEQFATRCAEDLEKMIVDEGPDTVAAMFCEPVMGAGGVIVPPKTYYAKIQKVLKKYDVLLVADEVINGFGRTGNMWGSETFDLDPDFLSCAKQLSSAYLPISALMISDKVYQAMVGQSEKLGIFGHGSTYGGHPVAAAVALETLKIYEERDIVGHVRSTMGHFADRLAKLGAHPLVGNARSCGLMGALELMKDKPSKIPFEAAKKVGAIAEGRCLENGLIVRAIGDNLAFCPPLITTDAEIDEIFDIAEKSLDETEVMVSEQGLRDS
ncbi:MAG: aspartate aminotransferase family protein [Rhodospirillales bacterium]